MKILITGAAGFIGSNLASRLFNEGHEIYALDDFSCGSPENLMDLAGDARFHFLEQSVTEPVRLFPDRIYNLACPASPVHYQKDPIQTVKTSVLGAMNMLDLARKTGARILETSTSEIYGEPLIHPQTEDYRGNVNPIGIRACYDESKRLSETLFFDYHRVYGVDIRVVRIFNTYGPHMLPDDGRVVSNFIRQALTGQNITIYGDGSQTRSFCYVDDLTKALVLMMEQEGFTGPVNLGNPSEYTVKDLATLILRLTGSSSRIVYRDLPSDDPTRRRPDISLAKEKLGWEPETPVEEGLQKTIAYFQSVL